jgi:TM2 domain-containing membrane protein YozV
VEQKRTSVAYLLWLLFGPFGAYRFYLGQRGWGVFYILTFGVFLTGWVIDLFMIPAYVNAYNHRVEMRRSGLEEGAEFEAGWSGV